MSLSHEDFIQQYHENKIRVSVHYYQAKILLRSRYYPARYRIPDIIFNWIFLISIPVFVVAIIKAWWILSVVLLIFILSFPRARKRYAGQFAVDRALEDKGSYEYLTKIGALKIYPQ